MPKYIILFDITLRITNIQLYFCDQVILDYSLIMAAWYHFYVFVFIFLVKNLVVSYLLFIFAQNQFAKRCGLGESAVLVAGVVRCHWRLKTYRFWCSHSDVVSWDNVLSLIKKGRLRTLIFYFRKSGKFSKLKGR